MPPTPGTGTNPMTETALVRGATTPSDPRPRIARVPLVIAALVVVAIVAGVAWWFLGQRAAVPDWDRVAAIDLKAPAGDAFENETPWVSLKIEPVRPGEANSITMSLETRQSTPMASGNAGPTILEATAQPLTDQSAAQPLTLEPDPASTGSFSASVNFDQPGWWRVSVAVAGATDPANFYLIVPDPNINGPGAVPSQRSSPEGEALYARGLNGITSLQSVRFSQLTADGNGNAGLSEHAVSAGGDGAPPGFIFRAAGGMDAVIIGDSRWIKLPGELGWTRQEGAITVPPSDWDEEYLGATGFTILGQETLDSDPVQLLAFVVPEVMEPRRQTAAWYLWWVDEATGRVRREAMVSRVHYMLNDFRDFDVPIPLEPPASPGTPVAATPMP